MTANTELFTIPHEYVRPQFWEFKLKILQAGVKKPLLFRSVLASGIRQELWTAERKGREEGQKGEWKRDGERKKGGKIRKRWV